jgi:L-histidine N-alpha-methyltransferase
MTTTDDTEAVGRSGPPVQIDRHLRPTAMRDALEADVRAGLSATPKTLPPKWFYDARGSQLFDAITRLPEYYPTRREREILHTHAGDIAALSAADTLVELGSGTSEKTRLLLDALREAGTLRRYVPFDVDETVLTQASAAIAAQHAHLRVHAVVGDFEQHLRALPTGGRRLIAFLGGTIGNLLPRQRARFLRTLASIMMPEDTLLLGTDLVKEEGRLVAAYNDVAGVTAEFNRNMLRVIGRELGADIDPDAFDHVAVWDAANAWIEMRLRSRRDQVVRVLDLTVPFRRGEELRTEVSAKFHHDGVARELAAAGLHLRRWWTDPHGDYAVSLASAVSASARSTSTPRTDAPDDVPCHGRTCTSRRTLDG